MLGFSIKLVLATTYGLTLMVTFFSVDDEISAAAWDVAGVATGSVTVPFIVALGTGLSARGRSSEGGGTFGVLCVAVMGVVVTTHLSIQVMLMRNVSESDVAKLAKAEPYTQTASLSAADQNGVNDTLESSPALGTNRD